MAEKVKWFENKARLVRNGLVNEVFTYLDGVTFKKTGALNLEPALIARHSQRLGELLDRCLAIRKDIRELEVLAFKAGADYELFVDTAKIDEQIDILRLQTHSKATEQSGFQKAAAAFATNPSLEKGLAEMARARDGGLGEDLKDSNEIAGLLTARWQRLRRYQDDYQARHTAKGNAHNYGERATLLLNVLKILLEEALARADALAAGIFYIYGVPISDLPASLTMETLDDFAMWALRTIRSLSRAAEQETDSEVVVPLVQPWLPTGTPLVTENHFNQAVDRAADGKTPVSLSFDLPRNNKLLDDRVRLRGIGVSFANAFELVEGSGIDRNQTADTFTRLTVTITTPPQVGKDKITYQRPNVLIGNVGLHSTSGLSSVGGNAIENLSPFGKWNIDIHPLCVWKNEKVKIISELGISDRVRDLKLTFRFYVPGPYVVH